MGGDLDGFQYIGAMGTGPFFMVMISIPSNAS
jgi:hypothetical protein